RSVLRAYGHHRNDRCDRCPARGAAGARSCGAPNFGRARRGQARVASAVRPWRPRLSPRILARMPLQRMTRRGGLKGALAAAAVVNDSASGLFLSTYGPAPLDPPQPYPGTLPPASPPPQMAAFQLPTGISDSAATFGYRGAAFSDLRHFVMTAVLVKHPRGD